MNFPFVHRTPEGNKASARALGPCCVGFTSQPEGARPFCSTFVRSHSERRRECLELGLSGARARHQRTGGCRHQHTTLASLGTRRYARCRTSSPCPLCNGHPTSTLPHHFSDRAGDNLGKVISQIIHLAGDAVKFPIEVIEPCMYVELDVPQLAGDEAELSRYRLTIRRFMPASTCRAAGAMGAGRGGDASCGRRPVALGVFGAFSRCARRTLQHAHVSQRALSCAVRENPAV